MKRIIYLLSLLALVFSCSKMEDGKSQGNYEMIDRVVANSPEVAPGTKTNVTGASVTWAADDKIAIMGSENFATKYVYSLEKGATTKKGVFANDGAACPDESGLLAVYPASMTKVNPSNKFTYITFPETQNYKEGGVATDLLAMYAMNTGKSNIQFSYLAGVLKLRFYAAEAKTIKQIKITNSSVPLAGEIYIYNKKAQDPLNEPLWNAPSWVYSSLLANGGKDNVSLSCNTTISTDEANPTDFYFVIPTPDPSVTLKDFSVYVETTDGAKSTIIANNAPIVQRGKITTSSPKELAFTSTQIKISINGVEKVINEDLSGITPADGSTIKVISPTDGSGNYTELVSTEQLQIAFRKAEETVGKVNLDLSGCGYANSVVDNKFSTFKWTKVNELKLPGNVTSIASNAFLGFAIDKLHISEKVTNIGTYVMGYPKGNAVFEVSPKNTKYCSVDGALYSDDMKVLYWFPNNLTSFSIPEGTLRVENAIFSHNNLQELTLPSTITALGQESLSACFNLHLITSNSLKVTMNTMQYGGAPGRNVPLNTPLVVKVPEGCKATYEKEWNELLTYQVAEWGPSRWIIDDKSSPSTAGATLGTPGSEYITL